MPLLSREIHITPRRLVGALAALCAAWVGAVAVVLLLKFALEVVRATGEGRKAVDLAGNALLSGLVLLLPTVLLATGARTLFRDGSVRWMLQGVILLVICAASWFFLAA
jgi:hypothetical protein